MFIINNVNYWHRNKTKKKKTNFKKIFFKIYRNITHINLEN